MESGFLLRLKPYLLTSSTLAAKKIELIQPYFTFSRS